MKAHAELDEETMQQANERLARIGLAPEVSTTDAALRTELNAAVLAQTPVETFVYQEASTPVADTKQKQTRLSVKQLRERYQERLTALEKDIDEKQQALAMLQKVIALSRTAVLVWQEALAEIDKD